MRMTTTTASQQTLLNKIRSTPKAIRKKLKISSDKSVYVETKTSKNHVNKDIQSTKKLLRNEVFHCRFLGQQTVYTLKPEDCYDFALRMEENTIEKQAVKVEMLIEDNAVRVTYLPPSPSTNKLRIKTKKQNQERPASEIMSVSPSSTPDEDGWSSRPFSTDYSSLGSLSSNYNSQNNQSNYFLNPYDIQRQRSNTFNSCNGSIYFLERPNNCLDVPQPEQIQLHQIAYCVTMPNKPRLFLLTSRCREGLTCKIFLFSSQEKSHQIKLRLAQEFEKAFTEWQSRMLRRRRSSLCKRTSKSSLSSKNTETSLNNVYENERSTAVNHELSETNENSSVNNNRCNLSANNIGEINLKSDEEFSDDGDREMHQEFKRRTSCMKNPGRLHVGEQLQDLPQNYNRSVLRNSACSDEFTSSEDEICN